MILASRLLPLLSLALWVLTIWVPILHSGEPDALDMVFIITALGDEDGPLSTASPTQIGVGAGLLLCAVSAWFGRSAWWSLLVLVVVVLWTDALTAILQDRPMAMWDGMDDQGRPIGGMIRADPWAGTGLWLGGITSLLLAGVLRFWSVLRDSRRALDS